MIQVRCRCGAKFEAKDDRAGKEFACNNCGETLHVPQSIVAIEKTSTGQAKDRFQKIDSFSEESEESHFHWIGRAFFIIGLLFILAGLRSSGSRYESKLSGEVHSFSQAAAKEQMFIVGSALLVAGTLARCRSNAETPLWETWFAIIAPFLLLLLSLGHFNTAIEVQTLLNVAR